MATSSVNWLETTWTNAIHTDSDLYLTEWTMIILLLIVTTTWTIH